MSHQYFQRTLLFALVLLLIPTTVTAQRHRTATRRDIQARKEKQTASFLVRNFDSGEVKLDTLNQPPPPRNVQTVPKHHYVPVPKGPKVPNKYPSPAINLFDFRNERSLVKNVVVLPNGGLNNQVSEPTVAVKGDFVFYTANHFAAFSTDGGQTYTYVSPWQAFNNTPYDFCCDQEVHYIPQIDMVVWSLQATNFAAQLILYATPENVRRGVWKKILFTPDNLGVPRTDLDYTDMSFGNNMLYWSTNAFGNGNSSVVVRIPLEGLRNGNPQPRASERRWGVRLVQNTGDAGYFAAHINSSSMYVYKWEEAAANPTWQEVIIPSWNEVPYATWGPVQSRIVGATRAGDELWITWNADERTPDRPTKYAQVARINARTFTLIDSPDVWNSDFRIGLPALATNNANEVGISYVFGRNHNHGVGILTGARVFFTTAEGGFDAVGDRWGDYLSIRQQYDGAATPQPTGLFAATGYTMTSNFVVQPRFILFGR
jgi:hypothetical protein